MGSFLYCPVCGGHLERKPVPWEPEKEELMCGSQVHGDEPFVFWQNSKPTVSAIIEDGSSVLLVRRAFDPAKGIWDIPGGFLELGEHPEEGGSA